MLHSYCGKGLLSWQYPIQFGKYLIQLSKFKINSYLEIGTRYGGTFVITVEYLNKFHPLKEAIGVDINYYPSLILYKKRNPRIKFIKMDSQSTHFKQFIETHEQFDLVLIDGSHEESACRNDYESVKEKAKIIVFHDIIDNGLFGVSKVWNEIKRTQADIYTFYEFIDQYESIVEKTGQEYLGIGMAVKKEHIQKISK